MRDQSQVPVKRGEATEASAASRLKKIISNVPINRKPRARIKKEVVLKEGITFREFTDYLKSHGFESVPTAGKHKVFVEAKSGALVVVPGYRDEQPVISRHLKAVDRLLFEKGITNRVHLTR